LKEENTSILSSVDACTNEVVICNRRLTTVEKQVNETSRNIVPPDGFSIDMIQHAAEVGINLDVRLVSFDFLFKIKPSKCQYYFSATKF
jgi:hypothetical protein